MARRGAGGEGSRAGSCCGGSTDEGGVTLFEAPGAPGNRYEKGFVKLRFWIKPPMLRQRCVGSYFCPEEASPRVFSCSSRTFVVLRGRERSGREPLGPRAGSFVTRRAAAFGVAPAE
jgi:hypothetical protein